MHYICAVVVVLVLLAVTIFIHLKLKKPFVDHPFVDPFMGYMWSDWRLADENGGDMTDSNCAPQYVRLPPILSNVNCLKNGDILYCESTESQKLLSILDDLSVHIILITGRYHIPSFVVQNPLCICENKYIVRWFAQNPICKHPKITPIPYGLKPDSIPTFVKVFSSGMKNRTEEVLHVGLLDNYPLRCNISPIPPPRTQLISSQDSRTSLDMFYKRMARAKCVISPCGDRCDCYRHVEAILLGCVPITALPPEYDELYKDVTINVSESELANCARDRTIPYGSTLPQITDNKRERFTKAYWEQHIIGLRKRIKETTLVDFVLTL